MRIASLVPSATEMLFALGLGRSVVAVTHECDHPAAVGKLPRLTRSLLPDGLDPGGIDVAVRERIEAGESLYALDRGVLADLEIELIVTQEVCAVCAVSADDVAAVASGLPSRPRVLSLDPSRLREVLDDAVRLGEACGDRVAGELLRQELVARVEAVRLASRDAAPVRVAAIEWLDPPYCAGHWLPEMIAAAGGVDELSSPGARSREIGWDEIARARPDVVVVMPCGLHADEAEAEARSHIDSLLATGASRIHAVDAAASFSRPGPRLVDGVELLGHILHPELVPAPAGLEERLVATTGVPPRESGVRG